MTGAQVLFVCTGNLYRSPLAERMLAARLQTTAPGIRVSSAGTHAQPGAPMHPLAASVLGELGGNAHDFATRRLTADLVAEADVVLGLAREHREAAARLHPKSLRRCFTLREFARLGGGPGTSPDPVGHAAAMRGATPPAAPGDDDIGDPCGLPIDDLRSCAARIDEALSQVADSLATLHSAAPKG